MVDVWPYSTQGTSDRTDWRTFMLRVHPSNSLASKKNPHIYWNKESKPWFKPYSEKLYAWPLELGMDLWLCTPARLHQISAQSVNQAHTLPLRPGLKNKPNFINIKRTDCHSQRWALWFANTHTHTQMAKYWPRDFATSSSFSWERLISITGEILVEQAEREREDSLNQLIYDKEKTLQNIWVKKLLFKTSPKSGPMSASLAIFMVKTIPKLVLEYIIVHKFSSEFYNQIWINY